jgi:outer membrane cobalamin receptor
MAALQRWVLAAALCPAALCMAAETSRPLAGHSLRDAIDELRRRGLEVIYSDSLVLPSMTVRAEPSATEPLAILDEILAPHALRAMRGPRGRVVVVAAPPPRTGTVIVRIDPPEQDVRARLRDVRIAARADRGSLVLRDVPPGTHTLDVSSPRFSPVAMQVQVVAGATSEVRVPLSPLPLLVEEVVVTPSRVRMLQDDLTTAQFLTREEVDRIPHLGDDIHWAIKNVPGVVSSDLSAELRIRGGDADEVLVLLDGVELYEPFHLKDFLKVFSIVDAAAVGGVDVITGGYPVEYGGRLSGVIDIATRAPPQASQTSLAVGTIESGVITTGASASRATDWLVSARGWYPHALLESYGDGRTRTEYYDALGRITHRLNPRTAVSAGMLSAYDDLSYDVEDPDGTESVSALYRSGQLWAAVDHQRSEAIASRVLLSAAAFSRRRSGGLFDERDGTLDVLDDRRFRSRSAKVDSTLVLGSRQLIKWGVEIKRQSSAYRYEREELITDPDVIGEGPPLRETLHRDLHPRGASYAAYLGERVLLGERLAGEIGVRWDRQSWTDGDHVAPRVSLAYAMPRGVTLRAGWGRYHQWQQLNELQIEDGIDSFHRAQAAEHWLLDVEKRLGSGASIRAGAYDKEVTRARPRFENLFDTLQLFPEAEADRVRIDPEGVRARGVELLLRSGLAAPLAWWVAYTLAESVDGIDGQSVPRAWDQTHALSFGISHKAGPWDLHLGGSWHSGWATTGVSAQLTGGGVELVTGPRNGERLPSYARLDARVMRSVNARRGTLSIVGDVLNLTGRRNVCCIDDFEVDGTRVKRIDRYWPRIIPSLGVRWLF